MIKYWENIYMNGGSKEKIETKQSWVEKKKECHYWGTVKAINNTMRGLSNASYWMNGFNFQKST